MDKRSARKVATIQARMGSGRLPGKIFLPLAGKPSLERMVERVRHARWVDEVVVATTVDPKDDAVEKWAGLLGIAVFRGSENDVLSRVVAAAQKFKADILVQLTGDCPLMDPGIIDALMDFYIRHDYDYVSNVLNRTYPRGFDTQIYARSVLEQADRATRDPAHREHVSLYIYEHPEQFKLGCMEAPADSVAPELRVCVDTPDDYEVVRSVFESLHATDPLFTSSAVVRFLRAHPEIARINQGVVQKNVRSAS